MTMWTHPTDAALMDVVEGTAAEGVLAHVARCARCRQRAEDAEAALVWTRGATVPDPAPSYWDLFRRRLASGIEAPAVPTHHGRLWTAGLLAAAAVAALVIVVPSPAVKRPSGPAAPALPAWSALPPADDDASLALLEHAAPAAAAAAPALECPNLTACVAGLSDDESRALVDELRAEIGWENRL
jgi:hypothetical protein